MRSKELLEINNFVACRSFFYHCFLDQGRLCANHDICGLAQSLLVVKETGTGTNIWQQKNYNYLTYTKKDYIYPSLAGSLCYCLLHHTYTRTRLQGRIGLKKNFYSHLIILRQNFRMSVSVLSKIF